MEETIELNRRLAVVNGATLYDKVGELRELVAMVRDTQSELKSISSALIDEIGAARSESREAIAALKAEVAASTESLRQYVAVEIDRVLEEVTARAAELSALGQRMLKIEGKILASVAGPEAVADVSPNGLVKRDEPVLDLRTPSFEADTGMGPGFSFEEGDGTNGWHQGR